MLKPWQIFAINSFRKDEFYEFPDFIKNADTDFERYSSHERFVWDTVERCGCIAAATLSMLFKPKIIVEMGVKVGWTSLLLCRLNPEARVYGVDISGRAINGVFPYIPTGYAVFMNNCQNYSLTIMNSWDFDIEGMVDLCFIDGDHFLPAVKLDTERAWKNRNKEGNWCIAWDDYHPNNPDVFNTVNEFVKKVNMPLQKIGSWYFISPVEKTEEELSNINFEKGENV
jgi:hypothetical protein